jgi:hypothetical protein
MVRLEMLGKLKKISMTSSELEAATFLLVAKRLDRLLYRALLLLLQPPLQSISVAGRRYWQLLLEIGKYVEENCLL